MVLRRLMLLPDPEPKQAPGALRGDARAPAKTDSAGVKKPNPDARPDEPRGISAAAISGAAQSRPQKPAEDAQVGPDQVPEDTDQEWRRAGGAGEASE